MISALASSFRAHLCTPYKCQKRSRDQFGCSKLKLSRVFLNSSSLTPPLLFTSKKFMLYSHIEDNCSILPMEALISFTCDENVCCQGSRIFQSQCRVCQILFSLHIQPPGPFIFMFTRDLSFLPLEAQCSASCHAAVHSYDTRAK